MSVPPVDWAALSPVVWPVGALLVLLLVDALPWPRGSAGRRLVHDAVALGGLLGSAGAVVGLVAADDHRGTLCLEQSCSYLVSPLSLTIQGLIAGTALACLLLSLDGPLLRGNAVAVAAADSGPGSAGSGPGSAGSGPGSAGSGPGSAGSGDRVVHHVLFLAATAGALALPAAGDLATLVVAFETASLPVIALVALRRDGEGAQAGVTLLLTAVASLGLLVLGLALLYLATGQLHLNRIAAVLGHPALPDPVRLVAVLGALLVLAGVAFKVSAVPFHLWTPDTYAGAPLPVTAFLAVVSKAAGVAAVLVLLAKAVPALTDVWAPVLGVLAAVTITVGNLVALRQRVAVRLLAWSTVAQAGWVLLPLAGAGSLGAGSLGAAPLGAGSLGAGSPTGGALRDAVAASLGYLVAYAVATLAVFAVVVLFARHHRDGEEHLLADYRGLARREPVAAAVLGFGLACLAGLPPGVMGLLAKVLALRPLVSAELWALALIAAANVALGLIYYLRWAAILVGRPAAGTPSWRVRPAEGVVLGAAAAACLGLSVLPQVLAGLVPQGLG